MHGQPDPDVEMAISSSKEGSRVEESPVGPRDKEPDRPSRPSRYNDDSDYDIPSSREGAVTIRIGHGPGPPPGPPPGSASGGMWKDLKDGFNVKIAQQGETAMPVEMPPDEVREIRQQDFFTRLQNFYEPTVYNAKEGRVTINLASLHRIQLMVCRYKLVTLALRLRYTSSDDVEGYIFVKDDINDRGEKSILGSVMHEYTTALEDWQRIKKHALNGRSKDPFIVTTDKADDLALIMEITESTQERRVVSIDGSLTSDVGEDERNFRDFDIENKDEIAKADLDRLKRLPEPPDAEKLSLHAGSRMIMNREEKLQGLAIRLGMALIGGAFLIVPMLIMVLVPGNVTALVTTSVFVFTFGVALALSLDDAFNVLSGTAAYAAILVVFVGSSN